MNALGFFLCGIGIGIAIGTSVMDRVTRAFEHAQSDHIAIQEKIIAQLRRRLAQVDGELSLTREHEKPRWHAE